jgi:Flp pilus assembly protein TadG
MRFSTSQAQSVRPERRRQSDSGQALVEFAVLLPLLAGVIYLIVQSASIYSHYVTITDATRAGARVAAVSRTAGDPIGATKAAVCSSAYNLDCGTLNPQVSPGTPWTPGSQVTVTATYPYSISFLGVTIKSGTMTSTTKERVE